VGGGAVCGVALDFPVEVEGNRRLLF
jgi:hypothetical protein